MNQGKLGMVKQEMARLNINILGISQRKWMGMSEFNSDDHFIYYCGKEFHRKSGVAFIVNRRVQNAVLGCNLKNTRMTSVHFQGKPFNMTAIQVYAPEKAMAIHASTLAWKIPWTEEPGRLQSMGSLRVGHD